MVSSHPNQNPHQRHLRHRDKDQEPDPRRPLGVCERHGPRGRDGGGSRVWEEDVFEGSKEEERVRCDDVAINGPPEEARLKEESNEEADNDPGGVSQGEGERGFIRMENGREGRERVAHPTNL